MRNPKLVPYETIVRATSGEPEAIDEVLRNFRQTTKPRKRNGKRKPPPCRASFPRRWKPRQTLKSL